MVDLALLSTRVRSDAVCGASSPRMMSFSFGHGRVSLRRSSKVPDWFVATVNVPRTVGGCNSVLATPETDAEVLLAVVRKLSESSPLLIPDPACWRVKRVELAIDYLQAEPSFSVERFYRFHSADAFDVRLVSREPGMDATCYLKRKSYLHRLYGKGAEMRAKNPDPDAWRRFDDVMRYEFVADGDALKRKGISNRLDGFCELLRSGEVERMVSELSVRMIASVPPTGEAFIDFLRAKLKGATLANALRYMERVEQVGAQEAERTLGMGVRTLIRTRKLIGTYSMEFTARENLLVSAIQTYLPLGDYISDS